jgi:hypothetical protein
MAVLELKTHRALVGQKGAHGTWNNLDVSMGPEADPALAALLNFHTLLVMPPVNGVSIEPSPQDSVIVARFGQGIVDEYLAMAVSDTRIAEAEQIIAGMEAKNLALDTQLCWAQSLGESLGGDSPAVTAGSQTACEYESAVLGLVGRNLALAI